MLTSDAQECKSAIIICTSSPSLASLLTPSLQVSTEHQTGLPSSLLPFSLALHLTPESIHMLMLFISIRTWFISSLHILELPFSFYCFFRSTETSICIESYLVFLVLSLCFVLHPKNHYPGQCQGASTICGN